MVTEKELIDFEADLVKRYHNGEIRSPIHLSGSIGGIQEKELIKIFKDVKPQDWIFTTYRSHYHALLKGMPKEELLKWVLDNKSIHLMSKEHKIVSSAIVGGTLPIALGTAMAIKLKYKNAFDEPLSYGENSIPRVYVFVGDMTASLGTFNDCVKYANFNELPITFVIEDNGLSTDTPTKEAWGGFIEHTYQDRVKYYKYKRKYPHYGIGKRIEFKT